jgi:hypothetical protein
VLRIMVNVGGESRANRLGCKVGRKVVGQKSRRGEVKS